MSPICSATTTSFSSHMQICFHRGLPPFSSSQRAFDIRCRTQYRALWGLSNRFHLHNIPFKRQATKAKIGSGDLQYVSSSSENPNISLNFEDVFSKASGSLSSSVDFITSAVTFVVKNANEAVGNVVSEVSSTVLQTREGANNGLTHLSSDLKQSTSKLGVVAVNVLRSGIVVTEDSIVKGSEFIVFSYGSAKELLPPEIQNVLNLTEEKTTEILRPVQSTFLQVYVAIKGLEKSLGLDPNDPIIPFVLFLGVSSTLWASFWILTYGGYSGDLSPKATADLLTGKENFLLIDVRPEGLRERDGIPDLRRGARYRYANVTTPEVDGSIKKLLKTGRDLDDNLIAAVIRNLKIVQDRSKVIVMDADGAQSKGIARSLRKLGVKRPYILEGGFRSWAKEGLRVKELKPETTFTILNEEAEAILEAISPTPLKIAGFGLGCVASTYALLEWEKTLQLIAVLGIAQTIVRRVASYEDAEDFKQDLRALGSPVKVGAEAFSWAAGKLETNGIGLPTSPSSSAVQNRVLQAAAKHESQPPNTDEISQSSDIADLSEA